MPNAQLIICVFISRPKFAGDVLFLIRSLLPNAGSNNLVEPLIRCRFVKRAKLFNVWTNLDIVKNPVATGVNFLLSAIQGNSHIFDVRCQIKQSIDVVSFSKEQDAIHAEILIKKVIDYAGGEWNTNVFPELR